MSMEKSTGGVSGLGLLGIVFVVLKLCGVIDWSWWWVTAPFWAGLAIFLVLIAVIMVGGLVVAMATGRR